jgi:CBS domain-containing protein
LTQLVYAFEDGFLKLPIHWMWWPMLGGLVVGIGGYIEPQALGVGYSNIADMLQSNVLPLAAILLLLVKALIWSVALGSGTSGGVLAPLLIIGGAMGTLLAVVLPGGSPGFWALLAMAATMGGTMRSPLTATFFAVELTGNTHVLLPLFVACASAHALTVLLLRRSILTEKISRHGHHLTREYRVDPFALTRVEDVMTRTVETLPGTMTLHGAAAFLTHPDTAHPSFPVVDGDRQVLGIVDPPQVMAWRRAGKHRNAQLHELLAGSRVTVAYPDEYLESLADRMMTMNVAHLPVVARVDTRLIGYIGWRDMMAVRGRAQAEEHQRRAYFRGDSPRRSKRTKIAPPVSPPSRSVVADVAADLAPEHPVGPGRVHEDDRQKE